MEKAPRTEEYRGPEEELEEGTEAEQEQTTEGTQESARETDYMRSTRRAAENAKNLGISGETFGALSLRNRTVLSLLDVPNDISDQVGEDSETIVFNADGVQFGEAMVSYAPEIQQQIHRGFFEQRILSNNFSEQLLDQNEAWRREVIEAEKKPLITPATGVFRDMLRSDYIDPKLLAHHEGLSNEEFAKLVQLETELRPSALAEGFFDQVEMKLPGEKDPEWHAQNAELYRECTRLSISAEEYKAHLDTMAKKRKEAWAIKATYDIFIEKMASPAFRPYKNIPRNPYTVTVSYYRPDEGDEPRRNILGEEIPRRKKIKINLQEQFHNNPEHPSFDDSIDKIAGFCRQYGVPLDISAISPTQEDETDGKYNATPSAVEKFISDNAIALNKFVNEYGTLYKKSKTDLTQFAEIVGRSKTFESDGEFIAALRATANFEGSLKIINEDAKIVDAINAIYACVSREFIDKIKFDAKSNDTYNQIKNEFDQIIKTSSESGGNLKSASQPRSDIQKVLSEKFGIEDDLDDNIEKIILTHSGIFSRELRKFLREERASKELQKSVYARSKAEKDFAQRLEDAGLKKKDQRLAECKYFLQISDLSDYLSTFSRLSASIRAQECTEHLGDYRYAETLRHAMGFKTGIEASMARSKPDLEDTRKQLERIVTTYGLEMDIDSLIEYFTTTTKQSCELRHKLAVACEVEKPRIRQSLDEKRRARLLAEDYDDSPSATDMAKAWAEDYASSTLFKERMQDFARSLGHEGLAEDIIFMPGYAVIHDNESKSTVIPIANEDLSESDDRTARLISRYDSKPPFVVPEEDEFARKFIAQKIETEVLKNGAVGSGHTERRIMQLEEKLGLEFFEDTIDIRTGTLKKEFTEAELNALETIFPFFGKFIRRIDNTNSYVYGSPDKYAEAISKSQQEFMCNEAKKISSSLFTRDEDGGRKFSLTALANIMRAKSIPQSKVLELIAYDTAIYDYGQLSSEELAEFQTAARDKISTNPASFMLLYQKLITNPVELRTCATRLAYCREFAKYCAGGSVNEKTKQFFDKRAAKAKTE